MLNLNNITLLAVFVPWDVDKILTTDAQDNEKNKVIDNGVENTIKALYTCIEAVNFSCIKFITSKKVIDQFGSNLFEDRIICEEPSISICNMKDYSRFMIYHLNDHISTDFTLTIQHDGFIINPDAWRNEFLNYDYIGAPWPKREQAFITPFGEHISVGNGGFSLRSKKLLELPSKVEVPFDVVSMNNFYKMFGSVNWNEDGNICVHNRHIFEENGCKFAPLEVAKYFSYESPLDINANIVPFGFHGNLPPNIEIV